MILSKSLSRGPLSRLSRKKCFENLLIIIIEIIVFYGEKELAFGFNFICSVSLFTLLNVVRQNGVVQLFYGHCPFDVWNI